MMMKLLKNESGAALPMAMLLMLIGAIVVVPLLNTVSTGSLIARHASFAESEDYAGDAGVEDAIWELLYNDLGSSIPNLNDTTNYSLGSPVNGDTVNVSVEYVGTVTAAVVMDSPPCSGGLGWGGGGQRGAARGGRVPAGHQAHSAKGEPMKLLITAVLIALINVSTYPAMASHVTGNELLGFCDSKNLAEWGFCSGFIEVNQQRR